jgi:hypothetical protein
MDIWTLNYYNLKLLVNIKHVKYKNYKLNNINYGMLK